MIEGQSRAVPFTDRLTRRRRKKRHWTSAPESKWCLSALDEGGGEKVTYRNSSNVKVL